MIHCHHYLFFNLQIFVSPFVALTVVSIGVPILLFYIYGVVPVSLCRSGGCDVSTSGSGFHFDFDDYSDADDDEDAEEGSERKGSSSDGRRGRNQMVTTELGARLGYRGGNIAGKNLFLFSIIKQFYFHCFILTNKVE